MDRNSDNTRAIVRATVALRKESVDRNEYDKRTDRSNHASLSARRAWIEIASDMRCFGGADVALRKESVDRNKASTMTTTICTGRSPQGERG